MAYRDKSQGFAFVYIDVNEFLKDQLAKPTTSEQSSQETLWQPAQGKVVNLNRPTIGKPSVNKEAAPKKEPSIAQEKQKQAVKQVRNNLDRLQSLHHKLHAMLEELNKSSSSRKKKK